MRIIIIIEYLDGPEDPMSRNYLLIKFESIESTSSTFQVPYTGVPELAPQRKQACADNKRDSKLNKINFLLAQITEL
jgi:hypothetical protein